MYGIYKKNYINILRLGYEKPTAFALCASRLNLDLVAFVRLSLFKTKEVTIMTHRDMTRIWLKVNGK
ncbi:hypothetical protein Hanom_Chr15g01413291 [Helianthus anomalus]